MGLILFVVSLQEGFYSYQFKRLGWTLLSTFCIVIGCSGLIIVLWRNRLWFFYALTCVSVHNAVDYFFCHFFPRKTPIMMLKPEASMEGFAAGSIACFVYFFVVSSIFFVITQMVRHANTSSLLIGSSKLQAISPSSSVVTRHPIPKVDLCLRAILDR